MVKNILITGVAGEIGIWLCNQYLNQGIEVYGIDHVERDGHEGLDLIGRNALFHFYNDSVKNVSLKELEGIECIFHLAQNTPKTTKLSELKNVLKDQQENMKHLIKYASKHDIKIILISSIEVYGTQSPISEESLPSPTSLYGAMMLSEETFLSQNDDEFQVDYHIIRIPTITGLSNPIEARCHKIDQSEKAGVSNQNREFNNRFTITKDKLITTCNQLLKGEVSQKVITVFEKK